MAKGKKRKPDLRKIRITKIYTVDQIATALDRNVGTVRVWIRDGLPVLDGRKPALIEGAALKSWLKIRWESKKQKCSPGEFYCCKCRKPRAPRRSSVSIHPKNIKTLNIKALCGLCGTRMNKGAAFADLGQLQEQFQLLAQQEQHLSEYDDPCVNGHHERQTDRPLDPLPRGQQIGSTDPMPIKQILH